MRRSYSSPPTHDGLHRAISKALDAHPGLKVGDFEIVHNPLCDSQFRQAALCSCSPVVTPKNEKEKHQ